MCQISLKFLQVCSFSPSWVFKIIIKSKILEQAVSYWDSVILEGINIRTVDHLLNGSTGLPLSYAVIYSAATRESKLVRSLNALAVHEKRCGSRRWWAATTGRSLIIEKLIPQLTWWVASRDVSLHVNGVTGHKQVRSWIRRSRNWSDINTQKNLTEPVTETFLLNKITLLETRVFLN